MLLDKGSMGLYLNIWIIIQEQRSSGQLAKLNKERRKTFSSSSKNIENYSGQGGTCFH